MTPNDIRMLKCYEGIDNYIFVSYAHCDHERVYPVITWLYNEGFRLWFDKGIELGHKWKEELQKHSDKSHLFLFFATRNSVSREECRMEIQRAIDKNKKIVVVFLDRCEITGFNKDFSETQNILAYEYTSENAFYQRFIDSDEFNKCRGIKPSDHIIRGPERREYDQSETVSVPTFNSVINNSNYGDERSFVRIRACSSHGSGPWKKAMSILPGRLYEIEVFIRNDASNEYNSSANHYAGVARVSRVSINKPDYIFSNKLSRLGARILSDNSIPMEVSDYVELYSELPETLLLRYIAGSARIFNDWALNKSIVSTALFTKTGTPIGLNGWNGVIPGGDKFVSRIRFVIQAETVRFDITTSLFNKNGQPCETAYDSLTVGHNEEIICKTVIQSIGTLHTNSFTMRIELPDGLSLVSGSAGYTANENAKATSISDSIAKQGISFGKIGSGNTIEVTCLLKVSPACDNKDPEIITHFSYDGVETVRSNTIHINQESNCL